MERFILSVLILLQFDLLSQSVPGPEGSVELIDQFLTQQKDLSGIFIIGSKGKIIYNKGFGYADRANQVPYTDQTLYTIGSITKPFTATAILLLVEKGMIKVEQPVSDFFLNVPDDKKEIKLHHLLTHTSGLPGAIGDDYEAITTEEFISRAWNSRLSFPPGKGYAYSNVGYSLLGMIVEIVSGKKYSEFLEKEIFQKAEMLTAGYTNSNADYARLAHGYLSDGSDSGTSREKLWNDDEPHWHLKSNGGLIMSALDMYQWYLALRDNKILKDETLKLQIRPHADEGGGTYYGYGYGVNDESVHHNGSNRIFKADFKWFPQRDLFFFSATNDSNVRLFQINDQIVQIWLSGKIPEVISWTPANRQDLGDLTQLVNAFDSTIRNYSSEHANTFISLYCTPDIINRNGVERMHEVFQRMSSDVNGAEVKKILTAPSKVQLIYPTENNRSSLKITLGISDNKLHTLNAEMEGM